MTKINSGKFSSLFVLTLFLQRPTALGQNYTAYGLLFLVFLTIVYIFLRHARICANPSTKNDFILFVALIGVYLIYESSFAIILGKSILSSWIKEFVATVVVVFCYGVFLSDGSNNGKFFWKFTSFVSVLGWSSAITLISAWVVGLDSLELFKVKIKLYEDFGGDISAGTIYFPFSMAYSSLKEADVFSLYRFSGFFREAGIYQAVASYCLVLALSSKRSCWVVLGLILGVVCTFSTIGLAMMAVAIGSSLLVRGRVGFKKSVFTGIILLAGGYVAFYAPLVGLETKREDAAFSVSFNERNNAFIRGLERFSDNPLGDGPFSGTVANDQITLLSSLGSIGAFGFLIQVILLSGLRPGSRFEISVRMAACLPILLTALFSQPIHGAPLVYVLLLVKPKKNNGGVPRHCFGSHKRVSPMHEREFNLLNCNASGRGMV